MRVVRFGRAEDGGLWTSRVRTAASMSTFHRRAGDLLISDNVPAARGRMPFEGERRILLAVT